MEKPSSGSCLIFRQTTPTSGPKIAQRMGNHAKKLPFIFRNQLTFKVISGAIP
jgi:hypothetical protein